MNNQTVQTVKKEKFNIFLYLCGLNLFFVLLELSFFIQSNQAYFVNFTSIAGHLNFPLKILPGIFYFLLVQLSLHALFCYFTWIAALEICKWFRVNPNFYLGWGVGVWIGSMIAILILNHHYYPNSKFAELLNFTKINPFITTIFLWFALGWLFFCLFASISFFRNKIILMSFLLVCSSFFLFSETKPLPVSNPKTNIIIVGIDSLRPDFVGYFGATTVTPFLDSFLDESAYFSEAITPLARTYPSWAAILTGGHPKEINVRFNLAKTNLNQEPTLADIFRENGYVTVYATDETRFSNIDESFGFDKIISPPMGLNDFLIGSFNDFPLSNLFINTPLGRWLFPYNYGNRGVSFSYEPKSFLRRLENSLAKEQKPIFLAVHFCLPHFPFTWRDQHHGNPLKQYQASITQVDEQIKKLFFFLAQKRILDNAVVVLLSDHGEGLELPGDRVTEGDLFVGSHKPPRFYPEMIDNEAMNQSAGHGTDVLGLSQYHTILAFRSYGKAPPLIKGSIPGIVSLIDIKPTLLELLESKIRWSKPKYRTAQSLTSSLRFASKVTNRHFFIESDFSPAALRTLYPQIEKVLLEGILLFQVDPNTARLVVKDDMGQKIIQTKQYADIYEAWMLAYYPQSDNKHLPILVNLETGQWTDDWSSPFVRHSPAKIMAKALKNFYGDEIRN